MQVGKCLTRSSKQQRLKYLSTDNDPRSSSWELLISVESRVKYRPWVLTAFDTKSTLRVLSDGAWIRWKCLVAPARCVAQCDSLLKIFGQGLIFLFQIKKKFEQCWKGETFQTCRYIHWLGETKVLMNDIPDSRRDTFLHSAHVLCSVSPVCNLLSLRCLSILWSPVRVLIMTTLISYCYPDTGEAWSLPRPARVPH